MIEPVLSAFFGLTAGILVGFLPGIGPATAMTLLFSLLVDMSSYNLIIFFITMMVSGQYVCSISAIYTGVPGAESAFPSAKESGYLIRNNLTQLAIAQNAIAAFVGSLVGLVLLLACIPVLAYAYKLFGTGVQLAVILGSIVAIVICAERRLEAVAGILIGFVLMYIGYNPHTYEYQLTFGFDTLKMGIPWMPLILGASVGYSFSALQSVDFKKITFEPGLTLRQGIESLKNRSGALARGSVLGFFIGLVPGLSYILSATVAYQVEKKFPAQKESDSVLNSLISSDAGHCSGIMGMLLPFLVLTIPITASEAVLFNILTVGPSGGPILTQLFNNAGLTITIVLIANFISLLVALKFSRVLLKIFAIPKNIFLTVLLVLCLVSVYKYDQNLNWNILSLATFASSFMFFRLTKFDPLPFIFSVLIFHVLQNTMYVFYQLYF